MAAPSLRMSAAEYLAFEAASIEKHQFLAGEVYAMAGGSPRHNRLGARTLFLLEGAHAGGPCAPLTSDQKIHVVKTGDFVYPDVSVVCAPIVLHASTTDVIENPRVVVEVLSKGTEQHDRDEKWEGYQSIPTLTDYVLVSQRLVRIEHFARERDGAWLYRALGAGEQLELTTGAVLSVDAIYEGVFAFPGDP